MKYLASLRPLIWLDVGDRCPFRVPQGKMDEFRSSPARTNVHILPGLRATGPFMLPRSYYVNAPRDRCGSHVLRCYKIITPSSGQLIHLLLYLLDGIPLNNPPLIELAPSELQSLQRRSQGRHLDALIASTFRKLCWRKKMERKGRVSVLTFGPSRALGKIAIRRAKVIG